MSNNVFRKYNQLLLEEKFYELKYNPSKKKKIKQKLMPLLYAIKNNNNNYDNSNLNGDDSISTIEAINNPYMKKFSDDIYTKHEKNELMNNLSQKKSKTNKSNKSPNYTSAINKKHKNKIGISEYADFLNIFDHKKPSNFSISKKNKNNFFSEKMDLMKKKLKSNETNKTAKKCYFCNIIERKNEKEELDIKTERNLSGYKKYIKIFNNFYEQKNEDNNLTSRKTNSENKKFIDMESELTKSKRKIKYKEIKRIGFDTKNLFLISKPLIPTIRGKISKNMKKRIHKPVRTVISCRHYSNLFNKIYY